MPLTSPVDTLQTARNGGWAIGGFNAYNLESARAVIRAAESLDSPVMVQFSHGAVSHAGLDEIVAIMRILAGRSGIPIALHLDHGKDPELAKAAVGAGFTSVMIDTSALPFDDNVSHTREIVEIAHAAGVNVEAELGQISGIEDAGDVDVAATLTVPTEAVRFVEETGVDFLAIAIGTSHGAAKFAGDPRLDFDRLSQIADAISIPLVLHGASAMLAEDVAFAEKYGAEFPAARGIPDPLIEKAIGLGISKINTDSDLRLAGLGKIRQVLADDRSLFSMYGLMAHTEKAIQNTVVRRITLFGSDGKA